MPNIPTIAVKETRADLLEIGPSTGLSGFRLVYVIGKGLYRWRTGDQSSNVPGSNDSDAWVAPSEDTSGKSGAWNLEEPALLDPEHATDSGTDTFVSATNTGTPGDGVKITRDFQSANTTTTPTLDVKTMTTRDGSALWPGAVSGPHELQYDLTADTYLVLEPLPIDEDDMASDSAAAVPTQQSVKAYADTKARIATGTYTGDGTTSQSITGVGFQPKYVLITRRETVNGTSLNVIWTNDQVSADVAGGGSIKMDATSNRFETSKIISLDADGFTVDDATGDSDPNTNGETYNYMAIG